MFKRREVIRALRIEQQCICLFCINSNEIDNKSYGDWIRNRHLENAPNAYICSRCSKSIYSI